MLSKILKVNSIISYIPKIRDPHQFEKQGLPVSGNSMWYIDGSMTEERVRARMYGAIQVGLATTKFFKDFLHNFCAVDLPKFIVFPPK